MNKTINELRKEIDEVDEQFIQLFAKRLEIVREIGKIKKENNIKPLDNDRWQEVTQKVNNYAKKHNISQELVEKIYELIHQAALTIEKGI